MILGIFMLGGLVPVPGIDGETFTTLVRQWVSSAALWT